MKMSTHWHYFTNLGSQRTSRLQHSSCVRNLNGGGSCPSTKCERCFASTTGSISLRFAIPAARTHVLNKCKLVKTILNF